MALGGEPSLLLPPPSIPAPPQSSQLASLPTAHPSRQSPLFPHITFPLSPISRTSTHAISANQNQLHLTSAGRPIPKLFQPAPSPSTVATIAVVAPRRPHIINDFHRLPPLEQALLLLGFILCMIVGTFVALFLVAVPTLIAGLKLLTSASKLRNLAGKELPGTIAAIKLSGIEINSLTRSLNYLKRKLKGRPFRGNSRSGDSDTGTGKNNRMMN